MNIKGRNLFYIIGITFAVACLFCTGMYALISKSVSFNIALKVDPAVLFALDMQIDYNGDGEYSAALNYNNTTVNEQNIYRIFNNTLNGAEPLAWSTVNQNCIVLNRVMAGENILGGITTDTKIKLTVTNWNDVANQYLHLKLNYRDNMQDFKADNGYGVVNVGYGDAHKQSFVITAQNTLSGYLQIPFLAELDAKRYYAEITYSEDITLLSANATFLPNTNFSAQFVTNAADYPYYSYDITIADSAGTIVKDYTITNSTGRVSILPSNLTGNVTIYAKLLEQWAGETLTYDTEAKYSGGHGTSTFPYRISTPLDLAQLSANVNAGYNQAGVYFEMTNDITFNEGEFGFVDSGNYDPTYNGETTIPNSVVEWQPIGMKIRNAENNAYIFETYFTGIFDGGNFNISGMYVDSPSVVTEFNFQDLNGNQFVVAGFKYFSGLFGFLQNGKIKNINVSNSYIRGYSSVASVAGGNNKGSVTNCSTSEDVSIVGLRSTYSGVGGICGANQGNGTQLKNCTNYASVRAFGAEVGGIAGNNYDGSTVQDCVNYGTISSINTNTPGKGGIVGINGHHNSSLGITKNCQNYGVVNASNYAGGIAGANYDTIIDCINEGSVNGVSYVGGICGNNNCAGDVSIGTILNCENNGAVTSTGDCCAGVVGCNNVGTVSHCINNGGVTADGYYCGGITGINIYNGLIQNCTNNANIIQYGSNELGGIAGENRSGTIQYCINNGIVQRFESTNYEDLGGVLGRNDGTLDQCVNNGDVICETDVFVYIGGVAGRGSGITQNCYNSGNIISGSSARIGGVCGIINSANTTAVSGKVVNCYSIGSITPTTGGLKGGVVGALFPYAQISYCYALSTVSGQNLVGATADSNHVQTGLAFLDSITKKPDNEVDSVTGVFETWDFDNVWGYVDGVNDNYPVLRCFYPDAVSSLT